jgi:hypothetical protein
MTEYRDHRQELATLIDMGVEKEVFSVSSGQAVLIRYAWGQCLQREICISIQRVWKGICECLYVTLESSKRKGGYYNFTGYFLISNDCHQHPADLEKIKEIYLVPD